MIEFSIALAVALVASACMVAAALAVDRQHKRMRVLGVATAKALRAQLRAELRRLPVPEDGTRWTMPELDALEEALKPYEKGKT